MENDAILTTPRAYLREFNIDDAEAMYRLNLDPEVIKYTGNSPFANVDEAREFLINYDHYKKYGYGRWAVINKESHEFLGWCGLKFHEEIFTDLGFRFFKKFWNKGYATETARASLEYGFNKLGLTEIIGRAVPQNVASIRVLEKLNMKFWKHDVCEGIENTVYYRINKSDFS